MEGFASTLNDRLLSEQAMNNREQSVYSATNSFGNGASAKSVDECRPACPFIEPAEGWSIEYSETVCEVSRDEIMIELVSTFGFPGNCEKQ